jgi:hypothetical protein
MCIHLGGRSKRGVSKRGPSKRRSVRELGRSVGILGSNRVARNPKRRGFSNREFVGNWNRAGLANRNSAIYWFTSIRFTRKALIRFTSIRFTREALIRFAGSLIEDNLTRSF